MNGYIIVRDVAEKWNMSVRQIQNMCASGKLDRVVKFGEAWAIPEDAEKPHDGRITSGSYKHWRKNSNT